MGTPATTQPDETETPEVSHQMANTKVCLVANLSGLDFAPATITHTYAGVGAIRDKFKRDIFRNKDSQEFDITMGHSADEWTFSLTADGTTYHAGALFPKNCSLTQEDWLSHVPVFFVLHPIKDGYSIVLPRSSSCLYNGYH